MQIKSVEPRVLELERADVIIFEKDGKRQDVPSHSSPVREIVRSVAQTARSEDGRFIGQEYGTFCDPKEDETGQVTRLHYFGPNDRHIDDATILSWKEFVAMGRPMSLRESRDYMPND